MRRVFSSNEDQSFANRLMLRVVAGYSTAALMVVVISASFSPLPIEAPRATASEIQRQADRVSRYRAARRHYATQDEEIKTAGSGAASAMLAAFSDRVIGTCEQRGG